MIDNSDECNDTLLPSINPVRVSHVQPMNLEESLLVDEAPEVSALLDDTTTLTFYPTALKGCWGIVFTHGVRMGGRAAGNSLSGLYLRNRKV